ncbi:type III effector Hrp-dependent outer domain protein [Marinomonas mediterranea MMB-1]|uniref:Type III effector Hrp-dependent outer domain protein n=2 Tax=Marinomonas mediterranea TaxID=119864 RepID=F2JYZ5_MARM1|nr:type III effector Hrp-dependent outer domain protein [Marinomonas mediterranea MMB-1]
MTKMKELAFYGDDFTGSTDVLESLSLRGKKTVLWLRIPTSDELSHFDDYDCIGLAGISRSKSPEWMSAELPEIFQFLRSVQPKYVHYKVCSTFDSSPQKGNLSKAAKIGIEILSPSWTSVIVGTPKIKRYVCFGNLFADFKGTSYRIDEHPVMGCHPATPMTEANLIKHINTLDKLDCVSMPLTQYHTDLAKPTLQRHIDEKKVVVFDSYDEDSHAYVGELINTFSQEGLHFTVSSSGFEDALYYHQPISQTKQVEKANTILALSGSCSSTTSTQIREAVEFGFYAIPLDLEQACCPIQRQTYLEEVTLHCLNLIANNQSPIVYSSLEESQQSASLDGSLNDQQPTSAKPEQFDRLLGEFLGELALKVFQTGRVKRLAVAGGDTSGYCIQSLGLDAMTFIAPYCPGVPLCKGHSSNPDIDGIEVALKGGQMGDKGFFCGLLTGKQQHG